jgi:transcriptional regulator with XRE-family HTH domain
MSIDPAHLGGRVRAHRRGRGLGVREAAEEAGVSPATLSRVERGDYLPGRDNLLKLAAWLGEAIDELDVRPSGHEGEPQSTPDAVALHLRADRHLNDTEAAILEEVFRSTYEALRRRRPDPAE